MALAGSGLASWSSNLTSSVNSLEAWEERGEPGDSAMIVCLYSRWFCFVCDGLARLNVGVMI